MPQRVRAVVVGSLLAGAVIAVPSPSSILLVFGVSGNVAGSLAAGGPGSTASARAVDGAANSAGSVAVGCSGISAGSGGQAASAAAVQRSV